MNLELELERITNPLRLAAGSHQAGSGKGCAMNVISYTNGDAEVTDYPECSARPLAILVQRLNDVLADPDDGYLSPQNSVMVLDLGWLTVGTANTPREVVWHWLADVLTDERVIRHAEPEVIKAIRGVAELCMRQVEGSPVTVTEWRRALISSGSLTFFSAASVVAYGFYGDEGAPGMAAFHAASAAAVGASVDAQVDFTRWAISRWRELAGLDPAEVDCASELVGGLVSQFSAV